MIPAELLGQVLGNLLYSYGLPVVRERIASFVEGVRTKTKSGTDVVVVLKSGLVTKGELESLIADFKRRPSPPSDVILVVDAKHLGATTDMIAGIDPAGIRLEVIEPKQLSPKIVGGGELDLSAPAVAEEIRDKAAVHGVDSYDGKHRPSADSSTSREVSMLSRQFSYPTVAKILADGPPYRAFRTGERVDDVCVVLSDIKSFSSFVTSLGPDDLRRAMSDYYSMASRLVWKHNGVLDKFIGDAVLAIFGYPYAVKNSTEDALKFSSELIAEGRAILDWMATQSRHKIETGTRVGIARGPLYPINLTEADIVPTLTFLGDTINVAARLEHASEVDGALVDNLAFQSLGGVLGSASAKEREVEAKGQAFTLRAWQFLFP